MTRPLPKLPSIGSTARNSAANLSECHLPPAELSSRREEVDEGVDEEEEEVSKVEVVVEDPTLTLREATGPVPTALVET